MRLARWVAKTLLILIVLCEIEFAWHLWRHGPPMEMVVTSDKVRETGEVSFKMVRIPISASDWTMLVTVIALQIALIGFLWWSSSKIARG